MPGTFIYLSDNFLVAVMDAIEGTDGRDATPVLIAQVV